MVEFEEVYECKKLINSFSVDEIKKVIENNTNSIVSITNNGYAVTCSGGINEATCIAAQACKELLGDKLTVPSILLFNIYTIMKDYFIISFRA
jgi:hypothetical protein